MYTTHSRYVSGPRLSLSAVAGTTYPGGSWSCVPITGCESVYSWRTGSRRYKPVATPYPGIVSGDLLTKIRKRTEYTNSLIREYSSGGRVGSVSHFSNTDEGHAFAVSKKLQTVITVNVTSPGSGSSGSATFDAIPVRMLPGPTGTNTNAQSTYSNYPWSFSAGLTLFNRVAAASRSFQPATSLKLQQELLAGLNPYGANNSAMTAIGELARGGLPRAVVNLSNFSADMQRLSASDRMKLVRSQRDESITQPGSADLSVRFGWAPLVKDLFTLIEACIRLDASLVPKNARRKRRRVWNVINYYALTSGYAKNQFGFPVLPDYRDGIFDKMNNSPVLAYQGMGSSNGVKGPGLSRVYTAGKGSEHFTQEISYSFSARYANGVRENPTLDAYAERLVGFLGLEITPEVIYDLTKWTWILDWFTGLGSAAKYVTDFGLRNNVVDYAYFTEHITTKRSRMLWNLNAGGVAVNSANFTMVAEEAKEVYRQQASPLGFGVSWQSLTKGQLDILSALGLIRRR